jgi:hypothetical protein
VSATRRDLKVASDEISGARDVRNCGEPEALVDGSDSRLRSGGRANNVGKIVKNEWRQ